MVSLSHFLSYIVIINHKCFRVRRPNFRSCAYSINLNYWGSQLTIPAPLVKCIFTVRFPRPNRSSRVAKLTYFQHQSHTDDEVRGLAEAVCGSTWQTRMAIGAFQFGQVRWRSFVQYTGVDCL